MSRDRLAGMNTVCVSLGSVLLTMTREEDTEMEGILLHSIAIP